MMLAGFDAVTAAAALGKLRAAEAVGTLATSFSMGLPP